MKTILSILLPVALLFVSSASAQSLQEEYAQAMLSNVQALDSLPIQKYPALSAEFERLSLSEVSDWLAPYYAAYCRLLYAMQKPSEADSICDEVKILIQSASDKGGDVSEIACLQSMYATARMLVNPQARWQKWGEEARQKFMFAQEQNPHNPRPYYLQGLSLLHTPKQFGGGEDVARPLLQKAATLWKQEEPSPSYAPHWGNPPFLTKE